MTTVFTDREFVPSFQKSKKDGLSSQQFKLVCFAACILFTLGLLLIEANRSFGPFRLPIYLYGSERPVITLATGICEEEKIIQYSNWTRDINMLVSGTFICTILTQINRLVVSTFREENDIGTEASFYASICVSCIAGVSCMSTLCFDWGGVCRDAFGVANPTVQWIEWMTSVPVMVFITLSMDEKVTFTATDKALIFSLFLCIFFGSLISTTADVALATSYLAMSFTSFLSIFFMNWNSRKEFMDCISGEAELHLLKSFKTEGFHQRKVLMKLRKLALTNCIANLFPFFPLIYLARVFNVIDDNITKVAFMCVSAFTKSYFASLCMDAHLEVSHSSVSLITAESMAHTSRREFLRFVFHELRGPLNSILLGAELLSAKIFSDPEELETVSAIKQSCEAMAVTFSDVTTLQRIEEGAIKVNSAPFSLLRLCESVSNNCRSQLEAYRVTLRIEVQDVLPDRLIGDEVRIKQIITNLVSNAICDSHRKGVVLLQILIGGLPEREVPKDVTDSENNKKDKSEVDIVFCVIDRGKGISEKDQLKDIFSPFQSLKYDVSSERPVFSSSTSNRSESSFNSDVESVSFEGARPMRGGIGLGLAICRELVHLLGGEITFESAAGKGSRFRVIVPFKVDKSYQRQNMDGSFAAASLSREIPLSTQSPYSGPPASQADLEDRSLHSCSSEVESSLPYVIYPVTAVCSNNGDIMLHRAISTGGEIQPQTPSPLESSVSEASVIAVPSAVGADNANKNMQLYAIKDFNVLIVDDAPSNRKFLAMLLKKKGVETIYFAEDGVQALDMALSGSSDFDIIFMDNTMPKMSGKDATLELRRAGFSSIVIGVTGNSMEDELDEFLKAGADMVFTKPLVSSALDALLRYFVQHGVKLPPNHQIKLEGSNIIRIHCEE